LAVFRAASIDPTAWLETGVAVLLAIQTQDNAGHSNATRFGNFFFTLNARLGAWPISLGAFQPRQFILNRGFYLFLNGSISGPTASHSYPFPDAGLHFGQRFTLRQEAPGKAF
jgi:hypothetical protein